MTQAGHAGRLVSRRRFLGGLAAISWILSQRALRLRAPLRIRRDGRVFDPRDYGARGDGQHDDTAGLQGAVDAAARRGGRVRVPRGTWRSGTLRLASRVTVELVTGAVLLASPDEAQFLAREELVYPTYSDVETSDFQHALLFGDGLERVAIVGHGTIDANRTQRFGPKPVSLRRCRHVQVRGITIRNSPNYCVSLGGCDDVAVEGVVIREAFADGIDPDSCRRVRIVGCDVQSDDDAIVLKSSLILGQPRSCENVTVTGCTMRSPSNGFKIGTETSGDFRRISVSTCKINGRPRPNADAAALEATYEGGGISIESVDGARIEGVTISDVELRDVRSPLFVRLGNRGRGQSPPIPGEVRDVTLRHVVATGAGTPPSSIVGIPGHPVGRVVLDDVHIRAAEGGTGPAGPVPEAEAGYPRVTMFGDLPAALLYVRHAQGVELHDVTLDPAGGDVRPPLVTDDATVRRSKR